MSRNITVTRTTTTTTHSSAIPLNIDYCKTFPGLLKLLEFILGAVCVLLTSLNVTNVYLYTSSPLIFFLVICSTFFIGTFCLIASCILSFSTAATIQKTLHEVIYHALAFALLLAAGITFLVEINSRYNNKYTYNNGPYIQCFTAAILGIILSGLYLLSTIFALRLYKVCNFFSEMFVPITHNPYQRGPSIIRLGNNFSSGNSGIQVCCCRCFTCINFKFLSTECGKYKIAEVLIGLICQTLAINYGMTYSNEIGSSYHSFLLTVSSCFMTSSLLLFCYLFSDKSFTLIRQSLFEVVFNTFAAISYLTSSSFLAYFVKMLVLPKFLTLPYQQIYPSITALYVLGAVLAIVHGLDAYQSFKFYRNH